MTGLLRAALAALVLTGTGACGGGALSAAPVHPSQPAPSATAISCSATRGLPLPAGWPAAVPLPPRLVVTRTERRSGDRLIAYGRVPGDFHLLVRFFNDRLPKAGYLQSNGQLDPFDAESDFAGPTTRGRWSAGLSRECEGQAGLTMLVLPTPS